MLVEWPAHPQPSLSAAHLPRHWALLSIKGDVLCWDGFCGVSEEVSDCFSSSVEQSLGLLVRG